VIPGLGAASGEAKEKSKFKEDMTMRFRWTIKDMETKTDAEILRGLVAERQSEIANIYTPFAQRLEKIYNKLDKEIQAGREEDL
jgi:hypothetical protein